MPFIGDTQRRHNEQSFNHSTGLDDATYGEVFNSSLIGIMSESLSISRALANDLYEGSREEKAKALFDSGQLDRRLYSDRWGNLNYDELNKKDPSIRTDEQVKKFRDENLERERAERAEIMQRNPFMTAEIAGAAVGYAVDPINLATMFISAPFAVAKGLGTLGNALKVGGASAGIFGTSEAAIQPFVLDFKQDIGAPYSTVDAIHAVAGVALGAGVIGGAIGGISGYLMKAKRATINKLIDDAIIQKTEIEQLIKATSKEEFPKIDDIPDTATGTLPDDIKEAVKALDDGIDALSQNTVIKIEDTHASVKSILSKYQRLTESAKTGISDKEIAKLAKEAAEIERKAETLMKFIAKKGGLNKKAFISEGLEASQMIGKGKVFGKPVWRKNGGLKPDDLQELLNESGHLGKSVTIDDALQIATDISEGRDRVLGKAEGDIADINRFIDEAEFSQRMEAETAIQDGMKGTGISPEEAEELLFLKETNPDEYNKRVQEINHAEQVRADAAYLEELERIRQNQDDVFYSNVADEKILEREAISEEAEMLALEEQVLSDFNALDKKVISVDGQLVDAEDAMAHLTETLDSLNGVMVCAHA